MNLKKKKKIASPVYDYSKRKCSCGAYICYKGFRIQKLLITIQLNGTNRQHSSQMSQNTQNAGNTTMPIEVRSKV